MLRRRMHNNQLTGTLPPGWGPNSSLPHLRLASLQGNKLRGGGDSQAHLAHGMRGLAHGHLALPVTLVHAQGRHLFIVLSCRPAADRVGGGWSTVGAGRAPPAGEYFETTFLRLQEYGGSRTQCRDGQ